MKIKKSKTNRNFSLMKFKDQKGVDCSIQKSSLATDECIWIGCDDIGAMHFVPNSDPAWKEVELPPDTIANTRMHLNRKQVEKLIPILQKFVETGDL